MKLKKSEIRKLYGAYGSNLHLEQMAVRCPDSERITTGLLYDYRLVFRRSGYADITPCKGGRVPVLLWNISLSDERYLDIYEGYPKFYIKRELPVVTGNGTVTAMFYVMADMYSHEICPPSPSYLATLQHGYSENGLPEIYLDTAVKSAYSFYEKHHNH